MADAGEGALVLPAARRLEGYDAGRIARLLATSEKEVQRTIFSARLRMRSLLIEQRSKQSHFNLDA